MNVYEVKFDELVTYLPQQKRATWEKNNNPIHVLANGDAMKAVEKAKRHRLKSRYAFWDENGRKVTEVVQKVRLVSVERVLTVDVR